MYYCDEREELSAKLEVAKAAEDELFKNDATQSERLAAIRERLELQVAIDCLAPRYQVGDGISCYGYSDIAPYTVIAVSDSGKRITVRACKAELDPSWKPEMHVGGFSAHTSNNDEQKWIITEDEEGMGCCNISHMPIHCPGCGAEVAVGNIDCWQDKSIDFDVTVCDKVYTKAPMMWDSVNLTAFIQHIYPDFTLSEFQKQFLHQIADTCGVPRKYLK